MPVIEINGLTKDYRVGFWRKRPWRGLDNVSFSVEQGEVFGFLGHNGAGKTTTLKILTGLIFPTAGTASILDKPLGSPDVFLRVGYLPENPYFYDYLTALELLDYFGRFFPLTASERKQRCETGLEQVGLAEFRNVPLRKFSKGMLQRLGIAQAVLHEPEVVMLDEPMSGLDPLGRRAVRDLIINLKAKGKTVFFSTHILSDAETLCDRVAILNRGKLVGVGQIAELLRSRPGSEAIVEISPDASEAELVAKLQSLAAKPLLSSGRVHRFEIEEAKVRELMALCASGGLRLVSLNPLHSSLEEYFTEISQAGGPAGERTWGPSSS